MKMKYRNGGAGMSRLNALIKKYAIGGNLDTDPIKGDPKKDEYVSGAEVLRNLADVRGTEVTGSNASRGGMEGLAYIPPTESTATTIKGLPSMGRGSESKESAPRKENMDRIPTRPVKLIRNPMDKEIQGKMQTIKKGTPMEAPNDMSVVIDPDKLDQGTMSNYTKTSGIKMTNPKTGKEEYYYAPSARGTKSRGGADDFKTFNDLPEELRVQAQSLFDAQEKEHYGQNETYRKRWQRSAGSASF